MLWELNAAPNSVSYCAADKQAHGPIPVCKRGWCHSGLTAFEVVMLLSASCRQSVQRSRFQHHLLFLHGSCCAKTHKQPQQGVLSQDGNTVKLRLLPAILQRLLLLCNIQGGILLKQEGTQAAATSTATCIKIEQPAQRECNKA